MFDSIFGGDDDDDDERDEQHREDDDWEIEVSAHTGFTNSADDNEAVASSWFRTHTIDLEADVDEPASPAPETTTPKTGPESPGDPPSKSNPQPGPEPEPESTGVERGTFVFPAHRDFMQKLEARGLNGAQERVETVYVLAGPGYTTPTDLFRLDNPEYYASATRRSVTTYGRKMARKVANLYPDGEAPGLIARFHTHPGGSTRPSDTDQQSASEIASQFAEEFGTRDFEFFQGIHAYKDHSSSPNPDSRHNPDVRSNAVAWRGEQYKHELALFGPEFRNPRQVMLDNES